MSLTSQNFLSTSSTFVGLANYQRAIAEPDFYNSIVNSLVFTYVGSLLQIAVGTAFALTLMPRLRGIGAARGAMLFSYAVPLVVSVALFKWIFSETFGIVNYFLLRLKLVSVPIAPFADPKYAMLVTILVGVWHLTPFAAMLILSRLLTIPTEQYEAAQIDGASRINSFIHVTLPNLRSVLVVVFLIRSIWMFRLFDLGWLLTQGGPVKSTEVLPILSYVTTVQSLDLGMGSTYAMLLFAIIFAISMIYVYLTSEK